MAATGHRLQLMALREAIPGLALGRCSKKMHRVQTRRAWRLWKRKKKKNFTAHLLLYLQ